MSNPSLPPGHLQRLSVDSSSSSYATPPPSYLTVDPEETFFFNPMPISHIHGDVETHADNVENRASHIAGETQHETGTKQASHYDVEAGRVFEVRSPPATLREEHALGPRPVLATRSSEPIVTESPTQIGRTDLAAYSQSIATFHPANALQAGDGARAMPALIVERPGMHILDHVLITS
ncbi:hypothetical protein PHLGIDRAFT_121444 [Phlebiopsis gigantea 11061_1 CR5-6]|uniref:Uncharacterized protein n=1 Tax=Phlebiopsis gigantea (strain 11061_1 CR5-6) TaxID=745531 RepID=A0A0C3S244_PHLG1|nr:hypothetical protein PHLGIDRAFT_121444 [Phlebiopsis gigantea 11061_1 CR5-6]